MKRKKVSRSSSQHQKLLYSKSHPEGFFYNEKPAVVNIIRRKACLGLICLIRLQQIQDIILSKQPNLVAPDPDPDVLLAFLAFSSPHDLWTTGPILDAAVILMNRHSKQLKSEAFIIYYLFQRIIRPNFPPPPDPSILAGQAALPIKIKPWKYEAPYAPTILEWAVSSIPEEFVTYRYRLFLAPIITILEDWDTMVRVRGFQMLQTLLKRLPKAEAILHDTQLGAVLEDVTFRSLPPFVTVSQTVVAAYQTIFTLHDIRFPRLESKDTPEQAEEKEKQRIALLDRIMRETIVAGFNQQDEEPKSRKHSSRTYSFS